MMKTVKLTSCLFLALLYSLVAFAEPVGTLTMEAGTLKVRRNRMDTIYTDPGLQIPVENGDEIQTGYKTRAKIEMAVQADSVQLFPNTFFIVTGVTQNTTELSMPAGKATFQIDKPQQITRKKRRRFRLRTANAVIGVKGTHFVVAVLNGNTNLLTLSGIVSLANIATPEMEVIVNPSQASKITASQQPSDPVTVAPEVREKIITSDTAESFEAVEFGDETETGTPTREQQETEPTETDEESVDALIEEVIEEAEKIEEDVSETQINRRSIEFKIVDE